MLDASAHTPGGEEGASHRLPQSEQSVPSSHAAYVAPGPPSSHQPSLPYVGEPMHSSEQHVTVTGTGGAGADHGGAGGQAPHEAGHTAAICAPYSACEQ